MNFYSVQSKSEEFSVVDSSTTRVSDTEKDILHYIGGYILRKLENKPNKQQSGTKDSEGYLELLQSMKEDAQTHKDSLTAIHDRGGLTYVKTQVTTLLEYSEHVFRSTFSMQQNASELYLKCCLENDDILTTYHNITYD